MAVRVGTCSWADRGMVKSWYPEEFRSPPKLLDYYCKHFDTVEVDSTYYAIPDPEICARWARRTPEGFIFHVKAFGMMTGHSVKPRQLPASLREGFDYSLTRYGNLKNPPPEMIRGCFEHFIRAVEPLNRAKKLGLILLQFPPYFTAGDPGQYRRNLAWIRRCREVMPEHRLAVEFRHRSWFADEVAGEVAQLLGDENVTLVAVDEPQVGEKSIPPVIRATGSCGYVRFHGRNRATWDRPVKSAAERFRYLYDEEELREWVEPLRRLEDQTETTYAMFNNCFADYAPANALTMAGLLREAGGGD
ncbi:MAG: DUF72 domain-containing protein [Bacillota bacterium]